MGQLFFIGLLSETFNKDNIQLKFSFDYQNVYLKNFSEYFYSFYGLNTGV